jgi:MFS family permease
MAQMSPSGSETVAAVAPPLVRDGNFQDWLVVATSTLCLVVSVIHIYSLGVFLLPIEHELGWSRAQITSGLTVVSVVSVICAPFIGAIIDRIGSRRIAIPGIIVYCAAVAALGCATGSVATWWALWLAIAAGSILIKMTVWMAAIAKRFTRRRGLAFAVALSGTGIGAAIMPVVATMLIGSVGWRQTYMILGLTALVIALPVLLIFFRDVQSTDPKAARQALSGAGVREGLTSGKFVQLATASVVAMGSIIALSVHFVPIMVGRGMSSESAAGIAGVMGVFSIVGRLCTGALLDRFHGPFVGAFGLGLPFLACILLLGLDQGTATAIVIAALIGFSLGAETDVVAFLTAQYFGLRNYGVLFGTLAGLLSLGSGVGPLFAGWLFDRFGNYDLLLCLIMPASALSATLVGTLGCYPDFARSVPERSER